MIRNMIALTLLSLVAAANAFTMEELHAIHHPAGDQAISPEEESSLREIRRARHLMGPVIEGISIDGSAFMGVYSLGVMKGLTDAGAIDDTTELNGASSGSQTVAGVCAGVPFEDQLATVKSVIAACDGGPGVLACAGALDTVVNNAVTAALSTTTDGEVAAGCQNRVFIATLSQTQPAPACFASGIGFGAGLPPVFNTGLATKADLILAARASSFIPGVSGASCFLATPQHANAVDGAIGNIDGITNACNLQRLGTGSCVVITANPNPQGFTADIRLGMYGYPDGTNQTTFEGQSFNANLIGIYADELYAQGVSDGIQYAATLK